LLSIIGLIAFFIIIANITDDDSSSIKLALLQKDELLLEKSADFDDLQADRVKIKIISIVTEINRLN